MPSSPAAARRSITSRWAGLQGVSPIVNSTSSRARSRSPSVISAARSARAYPSPHSPAISASAVPAEPSDWCTPAMAGGPGSGRYGETSLTYSSSLTAAALLPKRSRDRPPRPSSGGPPGRPEQAALDDQAGRVDVEVAGLVPPRDVEDPAGRPALSPYRRDHRLLAPGRLGRPAERGRGQDLDRRVDGQVVLLGSDREGAGAAHHRVVGRSRRDVDGVLRVAAARVGQPLAAGHELVGGQVPERVAQAAMPADQPG